MNDHDQDPDRRDTRLFVWLILIGLMVFVLAVGAGAALDAPPGSIAEWVAAVSTFAALLAAIVAAKFAAEALRVEQRRDKYRDEQESRAQADLVAVWAPRPGVSTVQQSGRSVEHIGRPTFCIRNASELPIDDVFVEVSLYIARVAEGGSMEGAVTKLGVQALGLVPPLQAARTSRFNLEISEAMRIAWRDSPEGSKKRVLVGIQFRDAGDRMWERPTGEPLRPMPATVANLHRLMTST